MVFDIMAINMTNKFWWDKYLRSFTPKTWVCFREGYSLALFRGDLLGGLTAGLIAFPVAMAFAIASGLDPQRGLFTSIVAGFLIALLGGSRVQISGTAAAFVAVIFDVVQRQGYDGLVFATLIAGVILILAGIGRLGNLIKYIPSPLITGFTAGIAVIIFSTQMKNFFGFEVGKLPLGFISQWKVYFLNLSSFDPATLAVALGSLIAILLIRRFIPVIPWALGSIALATFCVWFFNLPVQTIASKFGQLPSQLPKPSLPVISFTLQSFRQLFPDALTIAFLAGSKSLLSAVISDGLTGRRHKANTELVAVGIGNIASILFGGIPASAVIARTAANIKSGGKTPVSGMIHAITLFVIIFLAAPVMSLIPLPALSAILVVIAYSMCEKEKFRHLFKAPVGDVIILLTSFILTILVDITVAVEVGFVLAAFLFMKRMSDQAKISPVPALFEEEEEEKVDPDNILKKQVPKGVEVYEIHGPFFFGTANSLREILDEIEYPPKVFILRMRKVGVLDATGMYALKDFYSKCKKEKTQLLLSGIQSDCFKALKKFGIADKIGKKNMHRTIDSALRAAEKLVKSS